MNERTLPLVEKQMLKRGDREGVVDPARKV